MEPIKQPEPEKITSLLKLVITAEDVALGRADQKLADFRKMVLEKYSV